MMNKVVFPVILAIWTVGSQVQMQAQTQAPMVIEATKVVRLHEEIGSRSPIPIVKCLDLEYHGQLLAFGGDDHIVRLWNVQDQKFTTPLRGHRESVRGLAFSPDAARLVTVAQDGQIHFWNVQDGRLLRTLNEPVRGTRRVCFQPDGVRFAVCGFDKNVRIYDAVTYRLITTLPAHDTNNEAIAYSADGSLLAVGGRTGVVRIWRTSDNKHLTDIEGDGRRVRAIAFSPDGSLLATGGEGPFIMLWNPQDGELIRIFAERPGKTFALTFCGNDVLASGESDNMVRLWEAATGRQFATLSGHTGTISTMTFEPATQNLVTGSFDASVRFWSLPQGTAVSSVSTPIISVPTISLPVAMPAAPPEFPLTEPSTSEVLYTPAISAQQPAFGFADF
jgi:WD40 repeat protein